MAESITIGEHSFERGATRDVRLTVSESYTGEPVTLPLRVMSAADPGPVLLLCAAVHGNEINGVGIIRELVFDVPPILTCGTLICAPVVNIAGFESQQRYMPDGRDLNRCFPGIANGSLASRFAHLMMRQVIDQCDGCIDLHSAAATRTNYPNVRGDLTKPNVLALAKAFGCELLVNSKGPLGSLRRTATERGCPTIILEAGEVNKIEPGVLSVGLRGIRNVLMHMGMMAGEIERPAFQTRVRRSRWVRASLGGMLRFHVAPGDLVEAGQPLATTESVFGEARSSMFAQHDAIVLGMTTLPAVRPGEPVCHLAIPGRSLKSIRKAMDRGSAGRPLVQVQDDLRTNIAISRPIGETESDEKG